MAAVSPARASMSVNTKIDTPTKYGLATSVSHKTSCLVRDAAPSRTRRHRSAVVTPASIAESSRSWLVSKPTTWPQAEYSKYVNGALSSLYVRKSAKDGEANDLTVTRKWASSPHGGRFLNRNQS